MKSLSVFSVCFAIAILGGCGKGEARLGDEPTKYQSQVGLEKLTREAAQRASTATSAGSISDNPKFMLAINTTPASAAAKDIDSIIRPVLVKFFKDAKLVSAKGPEAPRIDGEVVEDRMIYSVKRVLTEGDGDALHSAFRSAGFVTSPRLGSKPTHSRRNVYMSLMRSTSQRGYSFVIIVETSKQEIMVESYRLGSKYDRLM